MHIEYTREALEALRDERYHRTPALRAHTEEQALAFVNDVGYCFLFGEKGAGSPICGAVGSRRRARRTEIPTRARLTWKDSPGQGLVLTAAPAGADPRVARDVAVLYASRRTMANLRLSPPVRGGQAERRGRTSTSALNEGPWPPCRLRQVAVIPAAGERPPVRPCHRRAAGRAQDHCSRFRREPLGYAYAPFVRRFPAPEAARQISTDRAMTTPSRATAERRGHRGYRAQRLFRWDPWE